MLSKKHEEQQRRVSRRPSRGVKYGVKVCWWALSVLVEELCFVLAPAARRSTRASQGARRDASNFSER